jgi:hypothetical protein
VDEKKSDPVRVRVFELINYQNNIIVKNSKNIKLDQTVLLQTVMSRENILFLQREVYRSKPYYQLSIYQKWDFSVKSKIKLNQEFYLIEKMIKYDSGANRIFGRGLTLLFSRYDPKIKHANVDVLIISEPYLEFKPYVDLEESRCDYLKECSHS